MRFGETDDNFVGAGFPVAPKPEPTVDPGAGFPTEPTHEEALKPEGEHA